MSDQLTQPTPWPSDEQEPGSSGSSWLPVMVQALIVIAVFAVAGALCGVLWEHLWTAPRGVVVDHQWFTDEEGLRGEFSGTGLYVLVAAAAGLLVGLVTSFLFDRAELVTLLAVAAGSVLAAWLMLVVGQHLGPPDPGRLAETAKEGTKLRGHLMVAGKSPYTAFPAGALVGLTMVFFGATKRNRPR